MPIAKERLKAVVDECFALLAHHDHLRSTIQGALEGPDPVDAIRFALATLTRPGLESTFTERALLKQSWNQNEWRKRYMRNRRSGLDPKAPPEQIQAALAYLAKEDK